MLSDLLKIVKNLLGLRVKKGPVLRPVPKPKR